MYYSARLIALTCIAILTLRAQPHTAEGRKYKVHVLGDSITKSTKQNYCWRYWLWLKLKENEQHNLVDFVGSRSGPGQDWDCQHDGHWGAHTSEILKGLEKWAPEFKADIALIHLGTNDMGYEATKLVNVFRDVIKLLRTHNDSVGIVIGQIPSWRVGRDSQVAVFNEELLTLKEMDTKGSPIRIIDLNPGWDRVADNYDGLHPNESGAKKYAGHFYPALINMINYKNGYTAALSIRSVQDVPVTVPWRRLNGQLFIRVPELPERPRVFLNIKGKRLRQKESFSR